MPQRRLGVLGAFGQNNLGDDALLLAFLQWTRRNASNLEPVALARYPQLITPTFGIAAVSAEALYEHEPAVPPMGLLDSRLRKDRRTPAQSASPSGSAAWRRSLRRRLTAVWESPSLLLTMAKRLRAQLKRVRSLCGVVVLGGNQLHDHDGGPLGHAYTLFGWALACKLRRRPFVVLSVGAERPTHRLGAFFLRRVLRWATYVSFRDREARDTAHALGYKGPAAVVPDLALGLSIERAWDGIESASVEYAFADDMQPRIVGLSPAAYRHPSVWPDGDAEAYRRYIDGMAQLCGQIVRSGSEVVLFPTHLHTDRVAMLDLLSSVPSDALHGVRMEHIATVPDLVQCVARLDAVVATRFHGVLFALWRSRPALSVAYGAKNDRLLETFGLGDLALHAGSTDASTLTHAFEDLRTRYRELRAPLSGHLLRMRHQIDAQYREVFASCGWEDSATMPLLSPGAARGTDGEGIGGRLD